MILNKQKPSRRLTRLLHGTDDESKGAERPWRRLGWNIKALREEDPAAAVLIVKATSTSSHDGGGKSAAAVAIFGKAGAQLLPFLKDLAEQQEFWSEKSPPSRQKMATAMRKTFNWLSARQCQQGHRCALLPTMAQLSNEFTSGTKMATVLWPTCLAAAEGRL